MIVLQSRPVTIATVDGLTAILDERHWEAHIAFRHPELKDWQARVIETLQRPLAVFRSRRDAGTRIYVKDYTRREIPDLASEQLTLLVYVRQDSGFVVTAHLTAAMLRRLGEKLWPL